MNTWIVIMVAGLASMGIPVLSFAATELSPTIGPLQTVEADNTDSTIKMEGVIIDPGEKSAVDKRIADCTVPEGARGFWAGADFGKNLSIGSSVQTQLIRYDITKGKASLNSQGIGGGVTIRYYNDGWMAPTKKTTASGAIFVKDIQTIKPGCRATTWSAKTLEEDPTTGKIAFPLVSVTLGAFAGKTEDSQDLSFQPALIIGLFRDLVNFGVGVNASGPDQGHTFLMLGIGTGFNF